MPDSIELQKRMIELVRSFRLHQPDQTPCGVSIAVSDAHALAEISESPSLTQGDLAERLRLEKSTVSRLAEKLERLGWVAREQDQLDRRVVRLDLTDSGRRLVDQLKEARTNKFAQVMSQIPPHQRNTVLQSLDVLIQAMGECSEEPVAERGALGGNTSHVHDRRGLQRRQRGNRP